MAADFRSRDGTAVDGEWAPRLNTAAPDVIGRQRDGLEDIESGEVELQPLAGSSAVAAGVGDDKARSSGTQKQKLYKVWPAQNIFFCDGRFMTSSGHEEDCYSASLCVWCLILGPSLLFFGSAFPHLLANGFYAWPVATLVVFLATVSLLAATSCTDPGIIPRRQVALATSSAADLETLLGYDVLGVGLPVVGRNGQPQVPEHLVQMGYRWCQTCRIVRPPRASHCPDCDNCVMRYDHHCPLVNNCVGQRNYHFFIGFLTCVWLLAMMVIPTLFWYASMRSGGMEAESVEGSATNPWFYLAVVGGTVASMASLGAMGLWLYHVFLIATRQTTKEFRRSIPNLTDEPTFWSERGPRLFDPRALVDTSEVLAM